MGVFFFVGAFVIALMFALSRVDSVDVRRFYFLNYLESWDCEGYKVYTSSVYRKLGECKELGLLSDEDLYIDLTGGANMCGLSDNQIFSLRMHQMCGNGESNRAATNLVLSDMRFDPYRHNNLNGKWAWYVDGVWFDLHKSWGKLDSDFVKAQATLGTGEVFIDKGSGDKVREELERKLAKIVWACKEVERIRFENKVEQINKRIKEL